MGGKCPCGISAGCSLQGGRIEKSQSFRAVPQKCRLELKISWASSVSPPKQNELKLGEKVQVPGQESKEHDPARTNQTSQQCLVSIQTRQVIFVKIMAFIPYRPAKLWMSKQRGHKNAQQQQPDLQRSPAETGWVQVKPNSWLAVTCPGKSLQVTWPSQAPPCEWDLLLLCYSCCY